MKAPYTFLCEINYKLDHFIQLDIGRGNQACRLPTKHQKGLQKIGSEIFIPHNIFWDNLSLSLSLTHRLSPYISLSLSLSITHRDTHRYTYRDPRSLYLTLSFSYSISHFFVSFSVVGQKNVFCLKTYFVLFLCMKICLY